MFVYGEQRKTPSSKNKVKVRKKERAHFLLLRSSGINASPTSAAGPQTPVLVSVGDGDGLGLGDGLGDGDGVGDGDGLGDGLGLGLGDVTCFLITIRVFLSVNDVTPSISPPLT